MPSAERDDPARRRAASARQVGAQLRAVDELAPSARRGSRRLPQWSRKASLRAMRVASLQLGRYGTSATGCGCARPLPDLDLGDLHRQVAHHRGEPPLRRRSRVARARWRAAIRRSASVVRLEDRRRQRGSRSRLSACSARSCSHRMSSRPMPRRTPVGVHACPCRYALQRARRATDACNAHAERDDPRRRASTAERAMSRAGSYERRARRSPRSRRAASPRSGGPRDPMPRARSRSGSDRRPTVAGRQSDDIRMHAARTGGPASSRADQRLGKGLLSVHPPSLRAARRSRRDRTAPVRARKRETRGPRGARGSRGARVVGHECRDRPGAAPGGPITRTSPRRGPRRRPRRRPQRPRPPRATRRRRRRPRRRRCGLLDLEPPRRGVGGRERHPP